MRLSVVLLVFTLLPVLSTFFPLPEKPASAPPLPPPEALDDGMQPLLEAEVDLRGLWIATVDNIDFPSRQGLSATELRSELCDIADFAKAQGFNAVFFQVRPAADALYASALFPASRYVSGECGTAPDEGFDCLAELVTLCHDRGIAVHAWVNPLRVRTGNAPLGEGSPALLHPDWVVTYAGKECFNVGLPEVREMVADGVREIAANYAVDGIVFDDYFYPYPVFGEVFDDAAAYAAYGEGQSLAAFRRASVNALVNACYTAVKEASPAVKFGVSPFGIWKNGGDGSDTHGLSAYEEIYCDALAWVKGGYVDYLAPQLYWSFDTAAAPFDTLCDWWNRALAGSKTRLYIACGAYRYAEGKAESGELTRQIQYVRKNTDARGLLCYGYGALKSNARGVRDEVCAAFAKTAQN